MVLCMLSHCHTGQSNYIINYVVLYVQNIINCTPLSALLKSNWAKGLKKNLSDWFLLKFFTLFLGLPQVGCLNERVKCPFVLEYIHFITVKYCTQATQVLTGFDLL